MIYIVEGRGEMLLLRAASKDDAKAWVRKVHGMETAAARVRRADLDELQQLVARGCTVITVSRPAPVVPEPERRS